MGISLRVGVPAPRFALPDVNGGTVSLDSLLEAHDAVAVIFGCNQCPYFISYEGRLKSIHAAYAGKGVALVVINPNDSAAHPEDSFEKMKEHSANSGFAFPYLKDKGSATAKAYSATVTPEAYLLDKRGMVRYAGRIDDCWQSERKVKRRHLKEAVEDILHGREVAVKSTPPVGCTIKWPAPEAGGAGR